MALQLVARGSDLESFKRAVSNTSGEGVTVLELDVRDKIVIPFSPDIPVGSIIRAALPAMDAAIKLVPGVHLLASSTNTGRTGIICSSSWDLALKLWFYRLEDSPFTSWQESLLRAA